MTSRKSYESRKEAHDAMIRDARETVRRNGGDRRQQQEAERTIREAVREADQKQGQR